MEPAAEEQTPPKIVVGLGNPGERYASTRHNVGFRVVEELARRRGLSWRDGECRARIAATSSAGGASGDAPSGGQTVMLVQPQTYMNRSGYTLRCLRERRDFDPQDALVVYDEIHLPLGKLRLRRGGSPAGHRGLESVIENLGTDRVPRLRLGVAASEETPPGEAWADFVLSPFAVAENEAVDDMIARAADACEAWLQRGIDAAMQEFNG